MAPCKVVKREPKVQLHIAIQVSRALSDIEHYDLREDPGVSWAQSVSAQQENPVGYYEIPPPFSDIEHP